MRSLRLACLVLPVLLTGCFSGLEGSSPGYTDPEILWRIELPSTGSAPVIAPDGIAYVCLWGGHGVIGVNRNGSIVRNLASTEVVFHPPAIDTRGRIYFGADSGKVYAYDSDGVNLWVFQDGGGNVRCSPSIAADGTIIIGRHDGHLYALNDDGTLKWSYDVPHSPFADPVIGSDGTILGRHRKLKPTSKERTAWGEGDGSSLTVYDRPYAKISGLNCWEHNMVLPGYALMSQGTQIHIAAWPGNSTSRHLFLSRAFASQAGAYVIDVGAILSADRVSEAYKDWVSDYPGESCIIDPRGEVIAGPAEGQDILIADGSEENIFAAKSYCDVAGHYSRPDVFQLRVNRTSHRRVVETHGQEYEAVEPEAAPEG
jgi:hypothetical protein